MIKVRTKKNFGYAFLIAIFLHVFFLLFFRSTLNNELFVKEFTPNQKIIKDSIKLDDLNIISKDEIEKIRRVGIKDGKKDLNQPDFKKTQAASQPKLPTPAKKPSPTPLSLEQLGAKDLKIESKPEALKPTKTVAQSDLPNLPVSELKNQLSKNYLNTSPNSQIESHFYYTPSKNRPIPRSREQDNIKQEATRNLSVPVNPITNKISNFEIRYDRPEGVSEDELNSDEKAYYSFYVRSYQNYFSKIFSNYEKIIVSRPGLARAFDSKHLLIGKIEYDENGEIISVKIIKSSENDDLHYFFEETLKQLNQPNPPKVFTKNKKQFSIYYQIQIN